MKIKTLTVVILILGLVFIVTSKVKADDSTFSEPSETPKVSSIFARNLETPEPSESPEASETPEPSETPRVKGIDRLKGLRLNFCQKHEDEIGTRLGSLGNLVANILGKFDAIATRVEQYYVNTVAPSGKVVPNYNSLVADIAAKRAAASTALTNAQADIKGFNCSANNPKGQITLFRLDMQIVKKALQDYRTSIKNLIVAVRSVVGETEGSANPSETPKPTQTPVATVTPSPSPSATPTASP